MFSESTKLHVVPVFSRPKLEARFKAASCSRPGTVNAPQTVARQPNHPGFPQRPTDVPPNMKSDIWCWVTLRRLKGRNQTEKKLQTTFR